MNQHIPWLVLGTGEGASSQGQGLAQDPASLFFTDKQRGPGSAYLWLSGPYGPRNFAWVVRKQPQTIRKHKGVAVCP